jgi:TolB-like protein
MKRLIVRCLFIGFTVFLTGCSQMPTYSDASKSRFIDSNYDATDQLLKKNQRMDGGVKLLPPEYVLVSTLVNVDNVKQSSRLGRAVAEQVGARFTDLGYKVIDLRMRQAGVLVKSDTGELALSRDVKELASEHQARAILVGTYAEAINMIYITLKLLDANSGQVMSAHTYALPLDKDNLALLRNDFRR